MSVLRKRTNLLILKTDVIKINNKKYKKSEQKQNINSKEDKQLLNAMVEFNILKGKNFNVSGDNNTDNNSFYKI